jgi:hypothetical protein
MNKNYYNSVNIQSELTAMKYLYYTDICSVYGEWVLITVTISNMYYQI